MKSFHVPNDQTNELLKMKLNRGSSSFINDVMKPGTDTLLSHPDSMLELPADRKKSLLNEVYGTPQVVHPPLPLTKLELESLIPVYENIENNECEMDFYCDVFEFD